MRYALVLLLCVGVTVVTTAQNSSSQTATKDPQAVSLLTQAFSALGGSSLDSIRDFRATGTITYYWAGKEVQGSATAEGKGSEQFRLDAVLPSGTRSWTVSNGYGSMRNFDGTLTEIPYHNAIDLAGLTLPWPKVVSALRDGSLSISYGGLQQIQGQAFHQVHLQKRLTPESNGPKDIADLFIDPKTFTVVGIQDKTHPLQTMNVDIPHAVYFADFRAMQGALIPFSVSEYVNNQKVWSLQLQNIEFNTGISDAEFHF